MTPGRQPPAAHRRDRLRNRPPREHQAIVQAAEIYALRRIESWKLRSRALRTADWRQLRNADALEHAALEKLSLVKAKT